MTSSLNWYLTVFVFTVRLFGERVQSTREGRRSAWTMYSRTRMVRRLVSPPIDVPLTDVPTVVHISKK